MLFHVVMLGLRNRKFDLSYLVSSRHSFQDADIECGEPGFALKDSSRFGRDYDSSDLPHKKWAPWLVWTEVYTIMKVVVGAIEGDSRSTTTQHRKLSPASFVLSHPPGLTSRTCHAWITEDIQRGLLERQRHIQERDSERIIQISEYTHRERDQFQNGPNRWILTCRYTQVHSLYYDQGKRFGHGLQYRPCSQSHMSLRALPHVWSLVLEEPSLSCGLTTADGHKGPRLLHRDIQ